MKQGQTIHSNRCLKEALESSSFYFLSGWIRIFRNSQGRAVSTFLRKDRRGFPALRFHDLSVINQIMTTSFDLKRR